MAIKKTKWTIRNENTGKYLNKHENGTKHKKGDKKNRKMTQSDFVYYLPA